MIVKDTSSNYSQNITKMMVTFQMNNETSFRLKEADLVAFMNQFTPEIDTSPYVKACIAYKNNLRVFHLHDYVLNMLNPVLEDYFFHPIRNTAFCSLNPCEIELLNYNTISDSSKQTFFDVAASIVDKLYSEEKFYITEKVDFMKRYWSIDATSISTQDQFHTVTLNCHAIELLTNYIRFCFNTYGEKSLNLMNFNAAKFHMSFSVESFQKSWPQDVAILESSGMTWESLCNFLHKYSLPKKQDT